ncbi:hypothetical protein C1645_829984 [Glomus cerebriforme]|uniref:Uncharacterized protein n=1 Tax=Glomus cerebriforme TaxID=658196 RepID=A0A397SMZ1_9GLOM|nr:hypothetical protein C1645_829984 [Glomus cerebriforme]
MKYFKIGFNLPSPNVVILNAGDPPSNDSAVHECLRMCLNEIDIENNGYINVDVDEAIFRRDYGIFNMAGGLGVRFLDKLEKGVDFRATSRVLELILVSVAIANQEIFLTKNYTTVERRVRNITNVTVADITKMKKERKIETRDEKELSQNYASIV